MHAEPGRFRHRVDQPRKRRAPLQHEVVALGVGERRHEGRVETSSFGGQPGGAEAGGIDHLAGSEAHRLGTADRHRDRLRAELQPVHRRMGYQLSTGVFGVGQQGQHQRVAVDDAGGRRSERGDAGECRFQLAHGVAVEQFELAGAAGQGVAADLLEPADLAVAGGDDQLAAAVVGDRAGHTVGVQGIATGDAQPRLEAARRVVEAGVDDFAVATADAGAECILGLQDKYFAAGERERPSAGQSDHAGADHYAIEPLTAHNVNWPPASRPASSSRLTVGRRSRPVRSFSA